MRDLSRCVSRGVGVGADAVAVAAMITNIDYRPQAQVLGTCTVAYTAGTLSSVIMDSKLDPKVQEYNEKMPRITEYLRMNRVPRWKRIEIREHFDRVFHAVRAAAVSVVLLRAADPDWDLPAYLVAYGCGWR
jgi:hypothetical protein